jgi:hypothetical protein
LLIVYALKSHGDGSSGHKKHGESREEQGGSTYVESVPYWTFKKLLRFWPTFFSYLHELVELTFSPTKYLLWILHFLTVARGAKTTMVPVNVIDNI